MAQTSLPIYPLRSRTRIIKDTLVIAKLSSRSFCSKLQYVLSVNTDHQLSWTRCSKLQYRQDPTVLRNDTEAYTRPHYSQNSVQTSFKITTRRSRLNHGRAQVTKKLESQFLADILSSTTLAHASNAVSLRTPQNLPPTNPTHKPS